MSRRRIILNPPTWTATNPFSLVFWIPGEPRPWMRPDPGQTSTGVSYSKEAGKNRERQQHVYQHVHEQLHQHYSWALPYLPLMKPGFVEIGVGFYFQSTNWKRPHTADPDLDNLQKNIGDALVGVLIQQPTLLYQNDSQIVGWNPGPFKEYWDPERAQQDAGYPQEVGSRVHVRFYPLEWWTAKKAGYYSLD